MQILFALPLMCSDKRINLKTFANSLFPGAALFRCRCVLYAVYKSAAKLVVNCVFHYDCVAVTNTLTNFPHRSQSLRSQSCEIIK